MSEINNTAVVKQQYATANNLNTRISIHDKYSTNKMGFGNWIVSNYKISKHARVLELGCGTADMWKEKESLIGDCSKIILSDFSEGMISAAKETLGNNEKIEYRIVDIQNIPFDDDSFDVVIANMMLYHVPNLDKGLSEVRRVLKKGGTFYCATYGEHGIIAYLSEILSEYGVKDSTSKTFTLQNGFEILNKTFSNVERKDYIDSLEVTDIDDMVEYIYSLSSMTSLNSVPKQEIKKLLLQNTSNGILKVPKEYGMFISS